MIDLVTFVRTVVFSGDCIESANLVRPNACCHVKTTQRFHMPLLMNNFVFDVALLMSRQKS